MCARVRSILGWEKDAATTRMPAGWEPEPRGGRGPLAARQTCQVSLEPGGCSGAGLRRGGRAGRPAPAREGRVRGAVRGLTTWARDATWLGSRLRKRRCGIARGRTSFAPTDGRPRLRRCSGGRAGRRAGNEAAGGGPLADPTASLDTRAGWESALRVEARDRLRTRLLHLARGPSPGRLCGQVCQRGLVPRRRAGDRSRTHCLARPAGRLGAGPTGGREKGWPVVAAGRRTVFPQGTPSWQGARSLGGARQALRCWSRAAGSNSVAAARQWRAGRLGGQRAGGRAGADRRPGEGEGGRKVSGV